MIPCVCLVQENQIPDERQDQIRPALSAFTSRAFGEPAEIRWSTVARGNGFTAAAPSTSSIVSLTAPQPLDQTKRAELLRALCDLWMGATDCSLNEIVAVINDPA